jgi:hypothetical protein
MQQFKTPHLYHNEFMIFPTFIQLLKMNHSLLIYSNHYSQIVIFIYYNILNTCRSIFCNYT